MARSDAKQEPGGAERGAHVCESSDPCVQCLADSDLAAELTRDQLIALFTVAKPRRLSEGEVLISEGEEGGPLFVIAKGELNVTRTMPGGDNVSLRRLVRGSMAGQLTFVDGMKRTATVTAANDGTWVFAIERKDVEKLLETDPLLVYRLMSAIIRSAAATVDEMNLGFGESMRYIRS